MVKCKLTSIIIPVYALNKELYDLTVRCLASIRRGTPENHEVILVDNASRIPLGSLATATVRVIKNQKNEGFAKAVNRGIRASKGDYIAVLNNDCTVHPGWLDWLIRALYQPLVAFASPLVIGSDSEVEQRRRAADIYNEDAFTGCAHLSHRWVYDKIGYFDERYFAGYEDSDMWCRVVKEGYRLIRCGQSFVFHNHPSATIREIDRVFFKKQLKEGQALFQNTWGVENPTEYIRKLKGG